VTARRGGLSSRKGGRLKGPKHLRQPFLDAKDIAAKRFEEK
jgi:hypothetical protein